MIIMHKFIVIKSIILCKKETKFYFILKYIFDYFIDLLFVHDVILPDKFDVNLEL